MNDQAYTQVPGVYRRRIGDIQVTALSDGAVDRTHEMMLDVSEEFANDCLKAAFRHKFSLSINTFLVQTGDTTVLIDTGSGDYLGPSAGHLSRNLQHSGVSPNDIDIVLLTHMHPDHSSGLTNPENSQPYYPNAELVVDEREGKHWFDDANMARASEREKTLMFQVTREQVHPYNDRIRSISKSEILPGISPVPCPGHTPGHTGFLISSNNEQLLIWGDVVHMPEVQFQAPDVSMVVDVDPVLAASSRHRILDMAASERLLVTGMHLHYPGFGYVDRRKNGYHFIPEPWYHGE